MQFFPYYLEKKDEIKIGGKFTENPPFPAVHEYRGYISWSSRQPRPHTGK